MNLSVIEGLSFASIKQSYDIRDTILYSLGLGYGGDPLDEDELHFVFEDDLRVVPSMCSILCQPGFWARKPEFGIDWVKLLHAEQAFTIHRPLGASALVRGESRILGVEDKGTEKGAMLHQEKKLYDNATDELLATVRSTLFLRGDGGQGSFGAPLEVATPLPERDPDRTVEIPTLERAALIYRLSGDWNPLHASPSIARKAGFPKPILHGLCTNGIACRALLSAYCENQPDRLTSMFVRFSRPVFPGETIRVEFFEDGNEIRFRAVAQEREIVVLDRCTAAIRT